MNQSQITGLEGEASKRCSRCKQMKLVSDYYAARGRKDGIGTICKTCSREWQQDWYRRNPEKAVIGSNARYRYYRYGLTESDYENLWNSQEYRSALSGAEIVRGRYKPNSGHVDHYVDENGHPVVRGLITANENTALGLLNHDPEMCRLAAEYLYRHHFDLRDWCMS